jgi:hypothetical protein
MHQRLAPTIILHYNPTLRDLQAWFWCVSNNHLQWAGRLIRCVEFEGLSRRQGCASFHLNYCITASLTISGLPIAFALAISVVSLSPSRQYTSRFKVTMPVNMLLDAPRTAADI